MAIRETRRRAAACLVAALGVYSGAAAGITISTFFVAPGGQFVGFNTDGPAGPAPVLNGAGNLDSIVRAAADWWELALPEVDPGKDLTIQYGWTDLSGGNLGTSQNHIQSAPSQTSSAVRFDNTRADWFADPTPHDNAEYTSFTPNQADLGGVNGAINTGRIHSAPTGAAFGNFDLLSVAKHEIGHALGFNSAATDPSDPPDGRLLDGTGLLLAPDGSMLRYEDAHLGEDEHAGVGVPGDLDLDTTLLWPLLSAGERRLPSAADILAVSAVREITQFELDPQHPPVPLPGALYLLLPAVLGLAAARARVGAARSDGRESAPGLAA